MHYGLSSYAVMERFTQLGITISVVLLIFINTVDVKDIDCPTGQLKSYHGPTGAAKVKLSVLISLRKPHHGYSCGPVLEAQLQVLAAVHWAVERINDQSLLPFAKLGYDLYDDCGTTWFTAQGLQALYGCHFSAAKNNCSDLSQGTCSNIGLIGMSRKLANDDVLDFTFKAQIPIVSPFTTGTNTPTYTRTIRSPDSEQAQLLLRVLKELGWTFVLIVHTDDRRSISAVQQIKTLANDDSICVDVLDPLPAAANKNESSEIDEKVEQVRTARSEVKAKTLGVIYFGDGYKGSLFSKVLQEKISLGESNSIQLILSDDVIEWLDDKINTSALPVRTLQLQAPDVAVQEFEENYNNTMLPRINGTFLNNPVDQMIEQFLNETGRMPSSISNLNRNPLVPEAIDAVYTLAMAYLKAQQDKCISSNPSAFCPELQNMGGLQIIEYVKALSRTYHGLSAAPSEFKDADRAIGQSSGFDIMMLNKSFGSFNKEKVGGLDKDGFSLVINSNEFPVSVAHGAYDRCGPSSPYPYAYVDGDILLLGVFPVHGSHIGNQFECGEFKTRTIHRILSEVFLYGIQKIRERTGINFGAIVFDSCESASRTIRTLSDFMAGDVRVTKPGTTEIIDPKKVRLVFGAYNSGVTVPVTMFYTNLAIPVVSYASSSPDLDDRLNYPYFLRSVPSDVEQAQAMVSVIKEMGWQFVSLLYVDNNYGKKGKQAFIDFATKEGICITQPPLALSQVRKDKDEDNDILTLLRNQKPEVVVLFLIEERVAQLLHTQQEQYERIGQSDNVIYLASEDWGQSQHVLNEGKTRTLGSITLKLGSSNAADTGSFASYIKGRIPSNYSIYNPFFSEMWANEFSCSPDKSFDEHFQTSCKEDLRISDELADEWEANQRVAHALNSMYAIGDGIKQEHDKLCNGAEEFMCQDFINHPELITKSIKEARFFDNGKEFAVFGDDGNGVTGFDILNVQKRTDGFLFYEKIGSSHKGELILDKNKLTFYNGEVTAQCGPDNCLECKRETGTNGENGGICSSTDLKDLEVRNIDLAVIVILAVVCALLVAKTAYDTIRFKRLPKKKLSHQTSAISLTEINYSGGSMGGNNYSGGSMGGNNYSGGSMGGNNYNAGSLGGKNYSSGTLPPRIAYDHPPPPKRYVRPGQDVNDRYQTSIQTDSSVRRKESAEYLQADDRRKECDSHIYNTANLVDCD